VSLFRKGIICYIVNAYQPEIMLPGTACGIFTVNVIRDPDSPSISIVMLSGASISRPWAYYFESPTGK
jgi:hypothetical protein